MLAAELIKACLVSYNIKAFVGRGVLVGLENSTTEPPQTTLMSFY